MFQVQLIIEKPRPDVLTPFTTFYDVSVSSNCFSRAKLRQFGASGTARLRSNHLNPDRYGLFLYQSEVRQAIFSGISRYFRLHGQMYARDEGNIRRGLKFISSYDWVSMYFDHVLRGTRKKQNSFMKFQVNVLVKRTRS